jgi:hypothetical protein
MSHIPPLGLIRLPKGGIRPNGVENIIIIIVTGIIAAKKFINFLADGDCIYGTSLRIEF